MASIVVEPMKDEGDEKGLLCIPLENLAEDGQNPEEGDEVNFDVSGTIERIEGNEAYVRPSEINGEPAEYHNEEEGGPTDMEGQGEAGDEGEEALKQAFLKANGA